MDSYKEKTLMVFENDEWHIKDANAIVQLLINNGCRLLFNHYDQCHELKVEDKKEHNNLLLNNLMQVSTRHTTVYHPTRRKVLASIRNFDYKKKQEAAAAKQQAVTST
jgi:hypothetical protein